MFKGINYQIFGTLLIILLAFNFFYLLHINNSIGERQGHLEVEIVELGNQIDALVKGDTEIKTSNNNDTINFLKEEYTNYRDFANNDRESFMNLINLFFVALGVLVTGGIIVLYWIFGQTKTEVKENADLTIKSSINEIEDDAKIKIESLIDPKIKDFEEKYNELERFMENQQSLRKSRVLVLTPESKKEEMERLEVMRIREIVGEAQVITLNDFKEFELKIDNDEVDIIVYRYEKAESNMEEERVREYIQALNDKEKKIPLVIYAKRGNLVTGKDEKSVESYPYSVMANMPTSLTSNMMSLANVLSYEGR